MAALGPAELMLVLFGLVLVVGAAIVIAVVVALNRRR